MAPELGQVGPVVIRTYTLFLDAAIVAGLIILASYGWQKEQRPAAWMDAGLGALVVGVIVGRLGHVAIYWAYFANHREQIFEVWRGGLDWHGAVVGGFVGLAIISAVRKVEMAAALGAVAIILPLSAALTYTGCLMTSCSHGREVESLANYPPGIAAELPDLYGVMAPRLASQAYGIALAIVVLGIALFLESKLRWPPALRFWIALALIAAGVFAIGFTQGDEVPTVGVLRLDQVLDLIIAGMAVVGIAATGIRKGRRRMGGELEPVGT